jgi:hypothetical protein
MKILRKFCQYLRGCWKAFRLIFRENLIIFKRNLEHPPGAGYQLNLDIPIGFYLGGQTGGPR